MILTFKASLCIFFTDILRNATLDYGSIVEEIGIMTIQNKRFTLKGSEMNWSLLFSHPSCKSIDISKYWNLRKNTPKFVWFRFKEKQNLGVSLKIEDKKKALINRRLRSQSLEYTGYPLVFENLMEPKYLNIFLDMSQSIHLEMEKGINCKNYQNSSYRECDENFVYNQMKSCGIMPFWAAKNLNEVTNLT